MSDDQIYMLGELYAENRQLRQMIADLTAAAEAAKPDPMNLPPLKPIDSALEREEAAIGEEAKQSGAVSEASVSVSVSDADVLKDPDVIEEDDPALAQPDAEEDLAGAAIVPAPRSTMLDAMVPEEESSDVSGE